MKQYIYIEAKGIKKFSYLECNSGQHSNEMLSYLTDAIIKAYFITLLNLISAVKKLTSSLHFVCTKFLKNNSNQIKQQFLYSNYQFISTATNM